MSTFEERAAARRATWTVTRTTLGESKPASYLHLDIDERWAAYTELNRRVWESVGLSMEPQPREDWPIERFDPFERS